MRRAVYSLAIILVLGSLADAQEMTLRYKPRQQPLSYGIKLHATIKAKGEMDKQSNVVAVLREGKITMDKDNRLVSQESVSYLDDQGKVIENPEDRTGIVITVEKRDPRGNIFPKKRKDERSPLIWPTLSAPRALPVFPDGEISVGETWTETVPVHSWFHTYDVVVTSKLESVEDRLGYKCAKIAYEFYGHWNVREQPDARKGAIDSMRFGTEEIVGSGVLYFGYEVGAIVQKEQELKYVVDEHTKHWDKEGQIAMTVDNYAELEFRLQMKLEE